MEKEKLLERQRDIVHRLGAVKLAEFAVNEGVVADALEKFLAKLGRSALPINWAADAQQAHALLARSGPSSETRYRALNVVGPFGQLFERDRGYWTDARDLAKTAAHRGALDQVMNLMYGNPVRRSIPWRLYRGRMTGTRGCETSPQHSPIWQAAGDALEYAARAAAEYAWAHEYHNMDPEFRNYDIDDFFDGWFPFVAAYEAGLWLFWITESEIVALSRPMVQLKGEQLHSESGPAVCWPSGEEAYFVLNNVAVPRDIVETPARDLDARLMLRERNTEVRRELVRKIGLERICHDLNAKCIDTHGDYELLLLDLQDGRLRPYLKMKNPSIGVYHIEGVFPGCSTVAQALAWRNQSDLPPSVLT